MATDEGRSLSSGLSIPQWMKRTDHKLDIEKSAYSPTELDDNFFYIRYPRAASEPPDTLKKPVANIIEQKPPTAPIINVNKPDFSKHTPPCQKFIPEANPKLQLHNQPPKLPLLTKPKSSGTDDGFKGEAAMCGSSVVKVAHQMVSGKILHNDGVSDCPQGFNPALRRGSKSLPSSPLSSPNTSPKSKRKMNKYFTGAFVGSEKYQGSWILSSLLGKRAISQSVGIITEETKEELHHGVSEASIDSVKSNKSITKQVFKAKPSELREMNFWSPTSM